ncbi:hypothetical protein B0H11DRAFT_2056343 [Mycena galericulata]|nr:hypothetical protein B0H11DRAFT_2056343 [Mycena galericulata]
MNSTTQLQSHLADPPATLDAQNPQSKQWLQPPSAWAALVSVQKENARLRRLLAGSGNASVSELKIVTRSATRLRARLSDPDEEDELVSEEEDLEDGDDEWKDVAARIGMGIAAEKQQLSNAVATEQAQGFAQQLVSFDHARLASLDSGLRALKADRAQLLQAQRQLEAKRTQLTAYQAELTVSYAELEASRARATRQSAADAQQNANRLAEAEARIKEERRELKGERARVREWKAQIDADARMLQEKRLNQDTQWLAEENARLQNDNARLQNEKTRLETRLENDIGSLESDNTRLEKENARLLDSNLTLSERLRTAEALRSRLEAVNPHLLEELEKRHMEDEPRMEYMDSMGTGPGHTLPPSSPPLHLSPRLLSARGAPSGLMLASPPPSSSPGPAPHSPRKRSRISYEAANTDKNEGTGMDTRSKVRRARPSATANKTPPTGKTPPPAMTTQPPRMPLAPLSFNAELDAPMASKLEIGIHRDLLYAAADSGARVRCRLCLPGTQNPFSATATAPWSELAGHALAAHAGECDALIRLGPAQLGEWRGRLGLASG